MAGARISEGVAQGSGAATAEKATGAEGPDDHASERYDSPAARREAALAEPHHARLRAFGSGCARAIGRAGGSDHGAAERAGYPEGRNREDGAIGDEAKLGGGQGHRDFESSGACGVHGDVRPALSPLLRFYSGTERHGDEGRASDFEGDA